MNISVCERQRSHNNELLLKQTSEWRKITASCFTNDQKLSYTKWRCSQIIIEREQRRKNLRYFKDFRLWFWHSSQKGIINKPKILIKLRTMLGIYKWRVLNEHKKGYPTPWIKSDKTNQIIID